MSGRIIPIVREPAALLNVAAAAATGLLADTRARPLKDLRISVTDRCNFRCTYCMPKGVFDKDYAYLPQASLLSFEEITRIAKAAIAHGVNKLRLTGGEPLLRKHIERLIEQLAELKALDGPLDLTLTTNASLLRKKAQALKAAGLRRLTISLDALDDATFRAMNDVDFPVADVLDGIAAAQAAGFESIKVNMVVKRGTNEHQVTTMARFFKGSGVTLRFIEFMDVGNTNSWNLDQVLPSAELQALLHAEFGLEPIEPSSFGETAERWRYADGGGEIGLISSVTQAFCSDCTRARLSTDGRLFLCLFAQQGHDLRSLMRGGADDQALEAAIAHLWRARDDRYSELRASLPAPVQRPEMSYIGG